MTDSERYDDGQKPSRSAGRPEVGRRDFLKYAATASAVLAVAGVGVIAESITNGPNAPPEGAPTSFPRVLVGTLSQLHVNTPVSFNYPLDDEPNLLVDVGQAAEGGVGPNKSIVAFSNICQHLGCVYDFVPPDGAPPCNSDYKAAEAMGYCCCHGSQYNFLEDGKVVGGPAPHPVPMVTLEIDSAGNIYATGMKPPVIYGKGPSGSSDVALDLTGGTVVGSVTT